MPRGEPKPFECLLCKISHGRHSVLRGEYFIDSGICKDCYVKMQNKPASVSCFGKLPSKKHFGYTSKHIACRTICPDKVACASFVQIQTTKGK